MEALTRLPALLSEEITRKDESPPGTPLAVWLRLQQSFAEKNNIALTTISRDGAVIGRVETDNSICRAMRVSAEHASKCADECGKAFSNAAVAGHPIDFRCHAGLHCFAIPIQLEDHRVVILGGRAFASTSEYSNFLDRYGEFEPVATGECLKSVRFADPRGLREAAELIESAASHHLSGRRSGNSGALEPASISSGMVDAQREMVRLRDQLESRKQSFKQFDDFLRVLASTLDSQQTYESVLTKFSEMMRAERCSLMILNEESNELALEAALGANLDSDLPIRVKLGEPIAGAVLASGAAMLVQDVDLDSRVAQTRPGRYKTRSFISFPITLGARKVGVVNLTDRMDGAPYDMADLALLELISPHLALIIDRTEWHRKAEMFQRMSLTDPLTGLPNRRYLEDRLFEEVERSKRYNTPLSFMIIDVDHFKSYNDIYGHTNADRALSQTALILRRGIRAIDMSARFAGDEFCIVLPETEPVDAACIAERLRLAVSQTEYTSEQGELMGHVTISVGISSFGPSRLSPLAIIETADRALYKAKTRGRNCVAVYEDGTNTAAASMAEL
jgi:diguanylate cyclase (GGDEF)-like protein